MGRAEPLMELRGVTKCFGRTRALDGVDLVVPEGMTVVLIGPSGCGKSTILRLMIGLGAPDSGRISFQGEEVRDEHLRALRLRMGYVIQEGGLFPHLSARDNVTLMARHLGWSVDRVRARTTALAELTHLPEAALDRYPLELSGGQRQRVSLMRALMLDPAILLLDEPLGALDPMIRSELQEDLRRIFRTLGKTVVLVTHDLGEAAFLCDRIVLLRDGQILQEGTIEDLVHSPQQPFVTTFVNAQRSLHATLEGIE